MSLMEQTINFSSVTTSTVTDSPLSQHSEQPMSAADKTIKNKGFSSVFEQQKHGHIAEPYTAVQADAVEVTVVIAPNLLVQDTIEGADMSVDQGKDLPIGGSVLPLEPQAPVMSKQPFTAHPLLQHSGSVSQVSSMTVISISDSLTQKPVQLTAVLDQNTASVQQTVDAVASELTHREKVKANADRAVMTNAAEAMKSPQLASNAQSLLQTETNVTFNKVQHMEHLPSGTYAQNTKNTQNITAKVVPTVSLSELSMRFQLPVAAGSNAAVAETVAAFSKPKVSEYRTELPVVTVNTIAQGHRQLPVATAVTTVPIEVGRPGWTEAVMNKVMWMSSQQLNSADIALDPPELGPLQVRISTSQEQTSVMFSSTHTLVREALDQGIARLREMMESQGINLTDVDVSDQNTEQRQEADNDSDELNTASQETSASNESSTQPASQVVTSGLPTLVDHYV